MEDLTNQFVTLWLANRRLHADYQTYGGGRSNIRINQWALHRLADRIERERAEAAKTLPAGAHEDIPGQMYLTDLPAGSLSATQAKGAA